jgi:primosomal protein N' (replication factor Y)
LIHRGYAAFAHTLLDERRQLGLPPCKNLALVRAEAAGENTPRDFLQSLRSRVDDWGHKQVEVLGPASAPIERIAGRYRSQLLLTSSSRRALHQLLGELRLEMEENRQSRKVRWSLDVDPVDLM